MNVVNAERQTYEAMWQSVPSYREMSPGLQAVDRFIEMSDAAYGTVLDAGCGAGVAGQELARRGFAVTLCDVTDAGLTDGIASELPFVSTCLWHDLAPVAYLSKIQRDAVEPGHPQAPDRFDYVFCCDVMEHIPTEYTMLTLSRLSAVAKVGMFLSISLVPDAFGVWVGKPLHQTVKPFTWWRDRLAEFGTVTEARDCLNAGIYWVTR